MTDQEHHDQSVELLQQLGLKEYEARCFVALSRLPSGSAKEISETSSVPRTRVYDAIRVLESKGLVEVQHSSPKRFRAVGVEEAASTLQEDFESKTDDLLTELRELGPATTQDEEETTHEVWSLSGETAIANRTRQLVGEADEEVVLVVGSEDVLDEELVETLQERRRSGVDVVVGAIDESLRRRIQDALPQVETFVSGLEWLGSPVDADEDGVSISRLLMTDRQSILVSSAETGHSGETVAEKAIFGTGFTNGLVVIARRLLSTGLEVAVDPARQDG